jgi:hypothetical protein
MRFYQEWNGFIWEFNSFGEFLKVLWWRFVGFVIGVGILFLLWWFFYNYNLTH